MQRALKHPLSFWLKKLVLKDADSGLDLLVEETHTYSLPRKRRAVKAPLGFGEPVHHERLEAEENHCLPSGKKVTKLLSFNCPSQKENMTMLYFKGSSYTLQI